MTETINTRNYASPTPQTDLNEQLMLLKERVSSISTRIKDHHAEILVKELALDDIRDTRANNDARNAILTSIEEIHASINELESRRTRLEKVYTDAITQTHTAMPAFTPPSPIPDLPVRNATSFIQNQQGNCLIPRHLPMFRKGSGAIHDVNEFIPEFEMQLIANGLQPDQHWTRLLPLCLSLGERRWAEHALDPSTSWYTAKTMFKRQFNSHLSVFDAIKQLQTMTLRRDETILEFTVRFQHVMDNAELEDTSPIALAAFEHALPEAVMGHLHAAAAMGTFTEKSISSYAAFASKFQDFINRSRIYPPKTPMPSPAKHEITQHYEADMRTIKGDKKWCYYHRTTLHDAADCYTVKKPNITKPPNDHVKSDPPTLKPAIRKIATISSDPPQHDPTPTGFNNPSISQNSAKSVTFRDHVTSSPTTISARTLKIKRINHDTYGTDNEPRPFEVPILINGVRQHALVDSGADTNFISMELVEQLDLPYSKCQGTVEMANPNFIQPRIGHTYPVKIQIGDITFNSALEILPRTGSSSIYIGKPAILEYGFDNLAFTDKYPRK